MSSKCNTKCQAAVMLMWRITTGDVHASRVSANGDLRFYMPLRIMLKPVASTKIKRSPMSTQTFLSFNPLLLKPVLPLLYYPRLLDRFEQNVPILGQAKPPGCMLMNGKKIHLRCSFNNQIMRWQCEVSEKRSASSFLKWSAQSSGQSLLCEIEVDGAGLE